MAFTTFTPIVDPSPGIRKAQELRLLKADFGEGYGQKIRDGYNYKRRKVSLTWDGLLESQKTSIIAFLEARGGDQTFWYQLTDELVPVKWTCEEWESAHPEGVYTITAEFTESFELEA